MADRNTVLTVFTKPWGDLTLGELAAKVKALGFDGVELPVRPGFQVEPEAVERALPEAARTFGEHGLEIASVAGPTDERTVAACAAAGVPTIRICVPLEDAGFFATVEGMRGELDRLMPALEDAGVRVGLQNHCGRYIANSAGLRMLFQGYPPEHVGAVWDAAHNALDGEEPEIGIEIVWSHLCMVNLKNAVRVRRGPPEDGWTERWVGGREGFASWPRVAAELAARRWRGPVCLTAEYSDPDAVDRLIAEDVAFARSIL